MSIAKSLQNCVMSACVSRREEPSFSVFYDTVTSTSAKVWPGQISF
jgi:hypothetical protein